LTRNVKLGCPGLENFVRRERRDGKAQREIAMAQTMKAAVVREFGKLWVRRIIAAESALLGTQRQNQRSR